MKKALFTLFAASLLMSVACTKKDVEVVLPEPATKAEAVSIDFNKGEDLKFELLERKKPNDPSSTIADQTVEVKVRSIDLAEGNRYVLYLDEKDTKATINPSTKMVIWMGRYTVVGQDQYKLDGLCQVTLDKGNGKVTIIPDKDVAVKADTAEYEYAATITPIEATSTVAANLARNWKVKNTYVQIEGGKGDQKVTVKKNFVGCDLHEIGRTLKENKVGLSDADVAQLAGYNLTELNFLGNGNMIMNFDGPESYYGTWNVSGNTLTWEMNDSNKLLSAKATGTVSFPGNKSGQLLINADVASGDEKYTGTIRFDLEQVD